MVSAHYESASVESLLADLSYIYIYTSLAPNSGGSYRSVFRLEADTSSPTVVLKIAQTGLNYKTRAYEYMRVEGAVAEALTPHPSLVDVYGFCALGLMVELMSHGDANEAAVP
jgi:hypothetical protein